MSPQTILQSSFPLVEVTPSVTPEGGFVISSLPRPGRSSPWFEPFSLAMPEAVLNGLFVLGEYACRQLSYLRRSVSQRCFPYCLRYGPLIDCGSVGRHSHPAARWQIHVSAP